MSHAYAWVFRWACVGMLAWAGCAQASPAGTPHIPPPPADLCTDATRSAQARHATPPGLLDAIARTESGRTDPDTKSFRPWPWTVNIGGAGAWFPTKDAAVQAARRALTIGAGNVDVGCMQVSLTHHPRAFRSLDEAFDPQANVDYAARFLVSLREAADGNWFVAVGLYHSRTPELARIYRERVTLAGTTVRPAGTGKLRVTLANGRVFTINTARQPTRRGRHRSACEVATILGPYAAPGVRAQACAKPAAAPPG